MRQLPLREALLQWLRHQRDLWRKVSGNKGAGLLFCLFFCMGVWGVLLKFGLDHLAHPLLRFGAVMAEAALQVDAYWWMAVLTIPSLYFGLRRFNRWGH